MSQRICLRSLAGLFCLLAGYAATPQETPSSPASPGQNPGVQITDQGNKLRIEIGGQLFTEYFYKDVPRPYLYPVMGPGNLPMTRNWPLKEVPDEEHDHPHHKSLWFTHGDVNKVDFWADGADKGKIVHDRFVQLQSGKDAGVIQARNKWVAPDGKVVLTDDSTLRIYNRANDRFLDFEVTLHASNGEVTFGDTKEGSMAIRLAETMRLKGKVGKGHIVNSAGQRDGDTWGKRAEWCDYYGPVNGETVGVAIFDHPQNPRYPTWWHVRDYGLFAVNPFGLHDFEKKPAGTGNLVIPAGQSVTFRYRFYFHRGNEQQADVAGRYLEYKAGSAPKP